MKRVLVAGGAGYIGSHICVELLEGGYEVVCADNFSNSSSSVIDRISEITGKKVTFYEIDLCDREAVEDVFSRESIDSIIHLAGLKSVNESVEKPLEYYRNNLDTTFLLCEAALKYKVKNFIFSSSATVYGTPEKLPLTEDHPISANTPYGQTKLFCEQILIDLQKANPSLTVSLLRYFNPVGAHESGLIGEKPCGKPNNLMPFITQVAVGKREELLIFGDDYDTPDGTGVRDFIHVVDLAKGHVAALNALENKDGLQIHNLGTGKGYSVLDLVKTFEKINQVKVPYKIAERRSGDIASCWADPSKCKEEFGWVATKNLEDMVRDSWNWQKKECD